MCNFFTFEGNYVHTDVHESKVKKTNNKNKPPYQTDNIALLLKVEFLFFLELIIIISGWHWN